MKKNTFVLFLIVSLLISITVVSCAKKQAEQPVQQTVAPEVVNTAVKQAEPEVKPVVVKEEPVVVKEEPVVVKEEPVAEPAPVEPVAEPIRYKVEFNGLTANAVLGSTQGEITFSKGVTAEQISYVINEFVKAHPEFAKAGIKYSVSGNPVKIVATYPNTITVADLEYGFVLASQEINGIVAKYIASTTPAEPVVVTPVVEPVVITPVVVEPVVEPVVVTPVVVEPVVEPEAEEKKVVVTNNLRFTVTPLNFLAKHKGFDYSFGAEFAYEVRFDKHVGIAAAVDYNIFFDDDIKGYKADHALYIDVIGYGNLSDKVALFCGFGPGVTLHVENKKASVLGSFRAVGGCEVRFNDLVALRAATGVEASFGKKLKSCCLKPVQIGVQFSL